MSTRLNLTGAIAVFLLCTFSSCTNKEKSLPPDELADVPFTRQVDLDTGLIMISKSVNVCDWKSIMESTQTVREEHGISLHDMYQGRIDTSMVMSVLAISDLDMAKDYTTSDVLMEPIKEVSTDKQVQTIFLDQQLEYTRETNDTLVFYMSFKTLNYNRWESAFLDDYREDATKDFEVIRVFRGLEERDQVHMIFLVNDPDYVEKMEKNNAFRMKMLAAGVVSYPVTYKLQSIEG